MIKLTEKERMNLMIGELSKLKMPNFSVKELYHLREFLSEIVVYNPFYKDRPYYMSLCYKLDFIIETFKNLLRKYNFPDDIEKGENIVNEIMKKLENDSFK